MRRLLFLTTALWLMLVLAVFIARLVGQPQKLPPKLELLHLTDCALPCWIGIVPGQTTIGEAIKRVKTFYGDALGYHVVFDSNDRTFGEIIDLADGFRLTVLFNVFNDSTAEADEAVVEKISLSEDDGTPYYVPTLTVRDLYYNLWGKPAFLMVGVGEGDSISYDLLYDNRQSAITVGVVTPDATIRGITLYHEMPTLTEGAYQPQPWQGFNASDTES